MRGFSLQVCVGDAEDAGVQREGNQFLQEDTEDGPGWFWLLGVQKGGRVLPAHR